MFGVRLLKRCFSRGKIVNVKYGNWSKILHTKPYNSRSFTSATSEIPKSDNSPLTGIRILDLTRIVAGPFCTMTLGDLGAEVIKIEMPGSGDETRKWGPPYITNSSETVYFISLNRNKKSVCINLKSGREIIYDLAAKCDVLIENYVPGKLDQLGLGYEDIKKVAPGIIYCSLTGYGSKGPYAKRPGFDVIASSVGGLLHITGPEGGEPCKVGVAMVDISTGLYAHGAILAALLQRTRTGKGQKIDCDLLSTQVSSLIYVGANYLNAGLEAKRRGTAHASIVPYQAFKTADGEYLTIGAGSDPQFQALCEKLNMKELASDEKYVTNKLRVQNRDPLLKILSQRFQKKSMSDWLKILEGAPFPYGPVNSIEKVFNDPHVKDIQLVKELKHPTAGTVKVIGPPVVFSDSENKVRLPPPVLGQHTDEILRNVLKYPADKIGELRSKGIVQ